MNPPCSDDGKTRMVYEKQIKILFFHKKMSKRSIFANQVRIHLHWVFQSTLIRIVLTEYFFRLTVNILSLQYRLQMVCKKSNSSIQSHLQHSLSIIVVHLNRLRFAKGKLQQLMGLKRASQYTCETLTKTHTRTNQMGSPVYSKHSLHNPPFHKSIQQNGSVFLRESAVRKCV